MTATRTRTEPPLATRLPFTSRLTVLAAITAAATLP